VIAQITFHWLDYAAIAAYAIVVIGLAVRFSRQQRTSKDYLLAGRSMGWVVVGISQLASLLSAITYLGAPGETYDHNLKYLIYAWISFLSMPVAIYLFLNVLYPQGIVSIFEYLERRFNLATRLLTSLFFIVLRIVWMATITNAVSIAVTELTGLAYFECIVLTAVVAIAYTFVGGMKAIIWTDVLQFCLFFGGLVGAVAIVFANNSTDDLMQVLVDNDKFEWFDASLDPTKRITIWSACLGGFIGGLALIVDQVSMQRYLSTRTLRDAQKAIWIKPILTIPVQILLYGLGLLLFAHFQLNGLASEIDKGDQAFPHFILHNLPAGLGGVIIAAIFAAAMSSIDSGIHTLSTVTIEDYYKRLIRPHASDRECLRLARILTLVWGALIIAVALSVREFKSIYDLMGKALVPFYGLILGIFFVGTVTRRVNAWGAFLGGALGGLPVLWIAFWVRRVDGKWDFFYTGSPAEANVEVWWMWYAVISFVSVVVFAYLFSLVGRAPHAERLRGLTVWSRAERDREQQ